MDIRISVTDGGQKALTAAVAARLDDPTLGDLERSDLDDVRKALILAVDEALAGRHRRRGPTIGRF